MLGSNNQSGFTSKNTNSCSIRANSLSHDKKCSKYTCSCREAYTAVAQLHIQLLNLISVPKKYLEVEHMWRIFHKISVSRFCYSLLLVQCRKQHLKLLQVLVWVMVQYNTTCYQPTLDTVLMCENAFLCCISLLKFFFRHVQTKFPLPE